MFQQVANPVGGSLALSALVAALPLLTLFVLLGALKWKAWQAGIASLVVALGVAIFAFGMPAGQALLAATEGAAFGLFPIIWIVLTAIWIFRMTELTGYDLVLRRAFGSLSPDQRIQAIIIAFCFGALLEALAGFGTPVAVTAVMLIAVGISPIKAASVALVANTAPVAFGAIAVPITTLGKITGLDPNLLGAMVGRQTPILAIFVPLILVLMVDGLRGVRQTWLAALVGGACVRGRPVRLARTTSPTRSPTSSRRWPAPWRWCCCCGSGSRPRSFPRRPIAVNCRQRPPAAGWSTGRAAPGGSGGAIPRATGPVCQAARR